jgi:formate dehydrogenase subunit gamma
MTTEIQYLTAQPAINADRVLRFTRTERATHWIQATSFLILLFTGFALMLPQLESTIGHRALMREIHLMSAFFFFFGPAIVALSADRRSVSEDVHAVDNWDRDDLRWLLPLQVLGIRTPPQGRFNAGQKLNAIFVVWSTITFTVTGLVIWQNRRFPSDLVDQSNTIHQALAYFALFAFLGHLYLATAYPKTRHAFRAITQGWVRSDWAEIHHSKWIQQLAPRVPAPPHDARRAAIQIVLGSFSCLFACRVFFFVIGANITDKVTERLYAITAWPGAASIQPQTGVRILDWIGLLYGLASIIAWVAADRLRRTPAP